MAGPAQQLFLGMFHGVFPAWLGVVAVLYTMDVHADQYRSEMRELDAVPAPVQQKSPQQLLATTTDPYAKALLLRDLAAQAAAQGKVEDAARYLEQALAQKALSGIAAKQLQEQLTELYLVKGDYVRQLPQLEKQLRAGQATPRTYAALGSAYLQQKRYAQAADMLGKAVTGVSDADPSWRRALAAALIGAGREREALPLLEKVLQQSGGQREDWLRLAALTQKFGSKARAAAVLELAARQGFLVSADDWLRLVALTEQVGAPFEAASLLQSRIELGSVPANLRNWQALAGLWIKARERALALEALGRALTSKPDAAQARALYRQQAQLLMEQEQYAAAATALEQAQQAGARDAQTWMALGVARYQQADIEGALDAFRAAQQASATATLATQWVRYLESGKARELALAAAVERAQRAAAAGGDVLLSTRLAPGPGDGQAQTPQDGARGSSNPADGGTAAAGGELTPIGAQRAGNSDGSIPAWTGGLQRQDWPADFSPGQRLRDPFVADRPLMVLTVANYKQFAARLSQGHQRLFERYPDYRMPVYATRRSVAYPKAIYDASRENLTRARLLGPDALSGARLGVPFPQPKTGVEVMWNHRTRYRGDSVQVQTTQAVVRPGAAPEYLKQTERVYFRYANLRDPVDLAQKNILLYYLTWFGKTRSAVDFVALVHETANVEQGARAIWVKPPKIPKLFRIPPVGYDQPFPGSEGLMFVDMLDMYNGAFDRYVWKLTGKRELYVPYNAYRLNDGRQTYAQMLGPHFLDPQFARYELHRVWVIEAEERGGRRHSFGKRRFYVDEDSWNILLVENEDHQGRLWRFQEGHLLPAYDIQAANAAPAITYDFKDERYFINRLSNEDLPAQYGETMRDNEFLPAAIRMRYAR